MRLLICAGGTGGGVNPALAVLHALGNEANPVLWVGGEGGMEADLVQREGIPFAAIPAAGVHGVGLRTLPGNIWKLVRGTRAARQILREFQPDVMLFTGGYVGVPVAMAGSNVPTLLYVPDIEPGMALKALARFADHIAVSTEASRQYFHKPHIVSVTGYPSRPELKTWDRQSAREKLGLSTQLPVVLIFGGSKGARSINRATLEILPDLLERAEVIHITGRLDWDEVTAKRNSINPGLASHYHIYDYLHEEMGAAFTAADLAVCRAGASTLGELPLFGLPAILIPYPYAWRYQKVNATYLANHGAAVVLEDARLSDQLKPSIDRLLSEPGRLETMRKAMTSLAQPQAAEQIANLIKNLAAQFRHGGVHA